MSARILTVDDSASMRLMVRTVLDEAGYEVHEAQHGRAGLEVMQQVVMDVIITDLYMPVMDGLTFVRAVRALEPHRFTPILLLTTEAGTALKQSGRAAGATGWLVKPFRPEQLRDVVARVLRPVETRA
jgi:two-component system chemotaxis response regulator CheY